MSVYVIVMCEKIHNPEEIETYRQIGGPSLAAHKPEVLLRGRPAETLEGPPVEDGVVLLRFPDMASARSCHIMHGVTGTDAPQTSMKIPPSRTSTA
jgi:uncharacterized protein (DUF1330 family)